MLTLTKDPGGRPATDIAAIRSEHPDLAKRADKAAASLSRRGLAGIRAQALLYVDHSGSMFDDYQSGAVQTLIERVLGFALTIDVDGTVPVIPWDSKLWPAVDVAVGNYQDVATRGLWHRGNMGSTRLDLALADIEERAKNTDVPLFAVVVTDGNPDNRTAATGAVCDLARHPVFIKFAAVRSVPYLDELDVLDASMRVVDNVDTKVFNDLSAVSDMAFADAMADEWDAWVVAAQRAGVLA